MIHNLKAKEMSIKMKKQFMLTISLVNYQYIKKYKN